MRLTGLLLMLITSFVFLCSCITTSEPATPTLTAAPNPVPSPTLTPAQTPKPVPEKTEEPFSTIMPPTQPSEQIPELDMVKDILGVKYLADGYHVECVLPSAIGLPGQLGLLPNGDIVINDSSFKRINLLSGGVVSTLVEDFLITRAVAAMPDGQVCYGRNNGEIVLIDPSNNDINILGQTPPGNAACALSADREGNVYAVTHGLNLYRFTLDGKRTTVATNLPYEKGNQISDIDVAADGTIYVAGWKRFLTIDSNGIVTTILDDLHDEPTWCDIDPDGNIYIEDLFSGVRRIDPKNGTLTQLESWPTPLSDFLAISNDEFIVSCMGNEVICSYHLKADELKPIFINAVNSRAFAAGLDDNAFLSTPSLGSPIHGPILKSHVIELQADGYKRDLNTLTYISIQAIDVDDNNRICLATSEGFIRQELDGSITTFPLSKEIEQLFPRRSGDFTVRNGKWYCLSIEYNKLACIYCFDENNGISFLPVSFDNASFGNNFQIRGASIDINKDGKLVLIVTARGAGGRGPFCQRVYQVNTDGTGLTQIANLDSERIAGMVDVAVGPDNTVYVLTCQDGSETIYRIDQDNTVSEFLSIRTGRDPKSIDVDANGNLWFSTTVGVFRIVRSR